MAEGLLEDVGHVSDVEQVVGGELIGVLLVVFVHHPGAIVVEEFHLLRFQVRTLSNRNHIYKLNGLLKTHCEVIFFDKIR